jgi:hypothetical protein
MIRHCVFPGCPNSGNERHHVVYASTDTKGDKFGVHYYCRKNRKGNTTEPHAEEVVSLCSEHHASITAYNERLWIVNRYKPLSCHQRRHYFELWLKGKYPPGVLP